MFWLKKVNTVNKLEEEKGTLSKTIERLEADKKGLKEEISDLKLSKKMEEEDIKHMVKINSERKDIEIEKQKLKEEGEDMMDYKDRLAQAQNRYQAGLQQVRSEPEPEGQKFPCRSRVRIADDLGSGMSHFIAGCNATVEYTYAHAYSGNDVKSYCLNIDGIGEVSWYEERQLTAI